MFKRLSAYIDIVTGANDYKKILKTIDKAMNTFESITHLSFVLEKPKFVYDLLIIEFEKLIEYLNTASKEETVSSVETIASLRDSYRYIIIINVPDKEENFSWLYENGIFQLIRQNYSTWEFDAQFDIFIQLLTNSNKINVLENIINSAQNSIVITDKKGYIEYANPYFANLTEYEIEELISNSPNVIKSGQHDISFYKQLWDTISSGKVWEGTFINVSKNKNVFYEEATITPIINSHNSIEKYLKIGKNITREKMLLEHLSNDVQVAKRVLNSFLPHKFTNSNFKYEYTLSEYNEIGGDFLYFARGRGSKFNFMLIDVAGHGVSSALIALAATQLFDAHISYLSLKDTVREINKSLCSLNDSYQGDGKYVTGIFAEIDTDHKIMTYLNAGHPSMLLHHKDGSVSQANSNNMMLGVEANNIMVSQEIDYSDIQKIIAFTDGLYENHLLSLDDAISKITQSINAINSSQDVINLFLSSNKIIDDETVTIVQFYE